MSLSNFEYWIQEHDADEIHTIAKIAAKSIEDAEICMYEVIREFLLKNKEEEHIAFYTILQIPKTSLGKTDYGQN